MGKKGSIQDIMYIGAIGMSVIILTILLGYTFNVAATNLAPTINATSPIAAAMLEKANTTSSFFINFLPIVLIFMAIASIILAYFVPTHPIFIGISLVLLVLIVYVSMYFSNILYEFFQTDALASYINNFPLVVTFSNNLPLFSLVFGGIVIIVMYARWRSGGVVEV